MELDDLNGGVLPAREQVSQSATKALRNAPGVARPSAVMRYRWFLRARATPGSFRCWGTWEAPLVAGTVRHGFMSGITDQGCCTLGTGG